jgi:membrane-bound serine protease (ClpP class)
MNLGWNKMNLFINPNLAYLLAVAAVMLAFSTILFPRANWPKIGMVICLLGAGFELFNLQANPWGLVMMALSPLPYYAATRQPGLRRILLLLAGMMIVFGSAYLFVDKKGTPVVHSALLFLVSIFCAGYIWVETERRLNAQEFRRGANPDSLVGSIGKATTLVDDVGMVQIDGDTWPARSDQPIPAGSTVRVTKCMGRILVVKKVEKLAGK